MNLLSKWEWHDVMATVIDAKGIYYAQLNEQIRNLIQQGEKDIKLINVTGQRYIGGGIEANHLHITIEGVAGEDLAAFMEGPTIEVMNNVQDGVGNTMNDGKIIVRGLAGDVVGYGMRGGKIFIRDDVGYRVGIHMKGFRDKQPVLVIGGCAGDFLGEYQAGGCLILLGMTKSRRKDSVVGDYCGTGMHGGVMYIRGQFNPDFLGKEVKSFELTDEDTMRIKPIIQEFASTFGITDDIFDFHRYSKIIPASTRPYGRLYAY
jgi:glutamate synthase domain-containing protein 3